MDNPVGEGAITVYVEPLPPPGEEAAVGASIKAGAGDVKWVKCLSIPKAHVSKFSVKPYKWVRFVTGIIVGGEGILCESGDANAPAIDHDKPLIPGESSLYYHLGPAERSRVFPLDPELANPYSVTGSTISTRRANFRDALVKRDEQCVASDEAASDCEAAHLIGHSKGDEYIKILTSRDHKDIIEDIDNPRNGILVNQILHNTLNQREAGFLLTPNFAMSTADVDAISQPREQRWTLHDFDAVVHPNRHKAVHRLAVPHNGTLRVPHDQSLWPSRIIFDTVYASAILKYYRHANYSLSALWSKQFYPEGVRDSRADGGKAQLSAQKRSKIRKRNAKRHKGGGGTEEVDPMDILYYAALLSRRPQTKEDRERWSMEQRELSIAKDNELRRNVTSWLNTHDQA